jgi:hypothetical protein
MGMRLGILRGGVSLVRAWLMAVDIRPKQANCLIWESFFTLLWRLLGTQTTTELFLVDDDHASANLAMSAKTK